MCRCLLLVAMQVRGALGTRKDAAGPRNVVKTMRRRKRLKLQERM